MIRVKATREGLIGSRTASGYLVDTAVPFVALPSRRALRRFIRIQNPKNGQRCMAVVLDVGPWNTQDHAYVLDGARPAAENGPDEFGRKTNGAGIDLGELVWKKLGMEDNSDVEWEFADEDW